MYNRVTLLGNLTRDVESRYLQSGTAIGKTAIAVTRKFKTADGTPNEKTLFIEITFWGKLAEVANQYLHKGSKVLIEGSLELEQWQDQNGQNRYKHSISVETMEMLGDSQNYQAQKQQQEPRREYSQQRQAEIDQANQEQKQQNQQDSKYDESNGSDGETIPF